MCFRVSRIVLGLAGLALFSCGDYSNEDLHFVKALPTEEELRVSIPAPAAEPQCGLLGASYVWTRAKAPGDGINKGVEWILAMVNQARGSPPDDRTEDGRTWGPFEGSGFMGPETRIRMKRVTQGDVMAFQYTLETRFSSLEEYAPLIDGSFTGASPKNGSGTLLVHADAIWSLGSMEDDLPTGDVTFQYDRREDPVTLGFSVQGSAFGLMQFNYQLEGHADASGAFHYPLDTESDAVAARYDSQGRGRAEVTTEFPSSTVVECWDEKGCRLWLHDPDDYLRQCQQIPCEMGQEADCLVQ